MEQIAMIMFRTKKYIISLLYEILTTLSSVTNRVLPKLHLKVKEVIILHARCGYILLGKIINIIYLGSRDPKVRSLLALADRSHEALLSLQRTFSNGR